MSTKIQTPILFNSKNCNLHIVVLLSNPFNFSLSLSLLSWWTIVVTVVPVVPLPAGWPAPPPPPGSASYPFLPNISYVMQLWFFFSPLLHNIQYFEKCYLNLLCNIWILLCDKQAMVQLFLRCYAHTALNPFFLLLLRISCENTTIRFESWRIIFFSYCSCVNHRIKIWQKERQRSSLMVGCLTSHLAPGWSEEKDE